MKISTHLTNAFRLAHRASEDANMPAAARNIFRAVATDIWKAYGKATLIEDANDFKMRPAAAPAIAEPAGDYDGSTARELRELRAAGNAERRAARKAGRQ